MSILSNLQSNEEHLAPYEAAKHGAAFFLLPESSYIRFAGEDRDDFLQRQTTNDVRQLSPERALLTVLTSPTARILDVFYLLDEPESIGAITLPGLSAATIRFLKSRIFFMDKVSVIDASAEFTQIELLGPKAAYILSQLGLDQAPVTHEVSTCQFGETEMRVLASGESFGMEFRLLGPAKHSDLLQQALTDAGASRLEIEHYHVLRVEAGLPAPGNELTEDYTPLEIGLRGAISDNKGCYTGQEVIARQITYEKVTRHLCGLKLDSSVSPGERVWGEGNAVGTITSVALSPRFGDIALAIIKRPYNQPGTALIAGSQGEKRTLGHVVTLPF